MTQIKFGDLKDFKKRADFDAKNADKINILFATYCDSVTDPVNNVSAFASSVKKQIADGLWKEHLDNAARSRKSRAKKAKEDKKKNEGNHQQKPDDDGNNKNDDGQQDLFDQK